MFLFISIFHSEFENLRTWEVRQKPGISVEIQKVYIKRIKYTHVPADYLVSSWSSFYFI